jgi:outer membrane protein
LKKNLVIALLIVGSAVMAQTPNPQPPAGAPASQPKAQTPPPPTIPGKIAVIRIQAAIANTKEGQTAMAAIQAKFDPKKQEFDRRQGAIQELQDQVRKGGATMSDETKNKLNRDAEAKQKQYERDVQDANDDLDQELGKVMNELGTKMVNVIISQYAAQNGYSVVLDVSNQNGGSVLWAAPSTDITADIIKLYDQTYPAAGAPAKPPAAKPPVTTPVVKK